MRLGDRLELNQESLLPIQNFEITIGSDSATHHSPVVEEVSVVSGRQEVYGVLDPASAGRASGDISSENIWIN